MEIDEGAKPEKNLFDFDDEKENDADNKDNQKKKIIRKERVKLDATYLTDNAVGLKHLYKSTVIDKEKNLQFKGKGNEASDLRKVMKIYRNWHFSVAPNLEFSYFAERMQKLGGDKQVKAFVNRLRKVYKGEDVLEEFANLNKKPEEGKQVE